MTENARQNWIGAVLASFLALAQFRLIAFAIRVGYGRSADAALGVVTGHPHWRIYQSRVLGPYLVDGLALVLPGSIVPQPGAFLVAHILYSIVTVAIAGVLAFRLGRVHGGSLAAGLLALALFELGFAFLLTPPWLYAWDYLDIIVFLVFADFVLAARPWPWFAALYAIAIWNRDSAQFIALWLILDPVCGWATGRDGRFERLKFLIGVMLAPAGMALVEALRRTLMIQEMGPLIFPDAPVVKDNAFFSLKLFSNLESMFNVLSSTDPALPIVVPLFVVLALVLAVLLIWRYPRQLMAYGLVALAMIGAELGFAALFETRTLVDLIPLVITAAVILSAPLARQPAPTLGELWRSREVAASQGRG